MAKIMFRIIPSLSISDKKVTWLSLISCVNAKHWFANTSLKWLSQALIAYLAANAFVFWKLVNKFLLLIEVEIRTWYRMIHVPIDTNNVCGRGIFHMSAWCKHMYGNIKMEIFGKHCRLIYQMFQLNVIWS